MIPLRPDDFYFPVKTEVNSGRPIKSDIITDTSLSWAEHIGFIPAHPKAHSHFRAIACGIFAMLGWPNASIECLQLISDTLCVAFAVDDMYDGDVPEDLLQTPCATDAFLSDLCEILYNKNPTGLDKHPLFIALADVKARLVQQGVSELWMQRFAASFVAWLDAVRKENDLKKQLLIPDAESLMAFRPDSGGVYLFMHFIEHANHLHLTPEQFDRPDIQKLRQIAGRLTIYPNEILSYQKELAHGHSINLITTLMQHEGMNIERAIQCIIDMHNIEMMSMDELASKLLRNPKTPQAIQTYITGIQHFVHGLFVWGMHAKRYSKDFFNPDHPVHFEDASVSHHRIRRISPQALTLLQKHSKA